MHFDIRPLAKLTPVKSTVWFLAAKYDEIAFWSDVGEGFEQVECKAANTVVAIVGVSSIKRDPVSYLHG